MVSKNPTGQQPMPRSPKAPGKEKAKPFGPLGVEEKPEGGRTKFDVPSREEDDFAIDEQREKRIRGNEGPKDAHYADDADLDRVPRKD
jgi:hypothetical protein